MARLRTELATSVVTTVSVATSITDTRVPRPAYTRCPSGENARLCLPETPEIVLAALVSVSRTWTSRPDTYSRLPLGASAIAEAPGTDTVAITDRAMMSNTRTALSSPRQSPGVNFTMYSRLARTSRASAATSPPTTVDADCTPVLRSIDRTAPVFPHVPCVNPIHATGCADAGLTAPAAPRSATNTHTDVAGPLRRLPDAAADDAAVPSMLSPVMSWVLIRDLQQERKRNVTGHLQAACRRPTTTSGQPRLAGARAPPEAANARLTSRV